MTDDLPAGRSSCILLGLPDDPRTHFSFAHAGHRCHALRRPEPVDEGFQETFCLAARHVDCPRYRVWAAERDELSSPAAAVKIGAATAASVAPVGEEAAAAPITDLVEAPTPGPEASATGGSFPADVQVVGEVIQAAADEPMPEPEPVAAAPGDQPREPGPSLGPLPAAAPSLPRGAAGARGPARGRGPGLLARLARGAFLLVVLLAAAGAAGYGLAFVLTRMGDGSDGAVVASGTPALGSPSAVAVSATLPTATATASKTARPTRTPTASPGTPAPTETPVYRVHVVKAGETISLIAAQYKTTVQAIVDLNKLTNPNVIFVGQKLLIPPP